MNKGKIVEQESHEELLAKKCGYKINNEDIKNFYIKITIK